MGEKWNGEKSRNKLKIGTQAQGDLAHLAIRHRSVLGLRTEIDGIK